MEIVILTHSQDNASVSLVSQAVSDLGAKVHRLDTDLYPQQLHLSSRLQASPRTRQVTARQGGRSIDLTAAGAIWYRRFSAGSRLPAELGETRAACLAESRQTLYGAIASLPCFQLDRLHCVRQADHKEVQLNRAMQLGLTIPDTLISNDPAAVREFCQGRSVITKTQTSFAVYEDNREQVVFTNEMRPEHLEDLDGLAYSPMMFQEKIAKQLELRATVVGTEVFCAGVDSQALAGAEIDWRRQGVALIEAWQPYSLPRPIAEQLVALTQSFGLHYAAADLVVTPDGEHVFLEINAGGEWFWLQPILPIAQALARCLVGKGQALSDRAGADERAGGSPLHS